MDPAKAEAMEKRKVIGTGTIGASWMAPFSKLFDSSSHNASLLPSTTQTPPLPTSRGHGNTSVARLVPSNTINVRFSGTVADRWPAYSRHPRIMRGAAGHMGIFAGAPHPDNTSQILGLSCPVCLSNSGTCRDWHRYHRQTCCQETKTIPVVTRRGCDPCGSLFPL